MSESGKVIELEAYKLRGRKQREKTIGENTQKAPSEPTIKELAYHMLKALECAKRLL